MEVAVRRKSSGMKLGAIIEHTRIAERFEYICGIFNAIKGEFRYNNLMLVDALYIIPL